MPAVRLAEGGFVLNSLADALNRALERSENDEFKRVYGKNGGAEAWQASDRLVLSDLGRSLRRIAEQGNDGFYAGETADLLAAEMEQGDGYISKEDLSRYAAVLRKPIRTTFRGNEIFSAPPPSSGGIALTIMLGILEHFDLKSKGRWAPQTVHLIIESMRRAYADRARHLGDSDFIEIPAHLTTKGYARELAASINLRQATMSEKLGPRLTEAEESPETTHYSVIDRSGMAVSNTYTLEQGYGSGVVVTGAGFLLNNEMGDFNRNPGVTNRQGSIGTPANLVVAEKRMLSSMTPTIAVRDGKVVLVTGSPGGRTIINTVLNVTLNVLEFGMSLRNAVDAPRLNMQWFPDRVGFQGVEDPAFADLVKQLTVMGHRVTRGGGGDANSILAKDGTFIGAADNENGGASAARR
jgi:gamma-glutamyltranspeptidase/glutathione hydrolase